MPRNSPALNELRKLREQVRLARDATDEGHTHLRAHYASQVEILDKLGSRAAFAEVLDEKRVQRNPSSAEAWLAVLPAMLQLSGVPHPSYPESRALVDDPLDAADYYVEEYERRFLK